MASDVKRYNRTTWCPLQEYADGDIVLFADHTAAMAHKDAQITKLKRLLLLTDPSVENVEMNELTVKQWGEYCKAFPDEVNDAH